jgi:predicted acylesterase/phospholipase RssA
MALVAEAQVPARPTPWWWRGYSLHDGVFKGGGAKGVLYAGALLAMEERKRWFRSVAGSSAGAITATLIAAGLHPQTIAAMAEEGAGKVQLFPLGDLAGQPLFRTRGLRKWLDETLRQALLEHGHAVPGPEPVRFRDLEVTEIELFVVCVDVVTRQPRVFGTRLTPDLEVVDAVLASCAIPMAFRQGRLEVEAVEGQEEARVHRLIDGGVWANYPSFVFRDPSFRAYHGLEAPEPDLMLGFALEGPAATLTPARRLLPKWGRLHSREDYGAQTRGRSIFAWALLRTWFFFLLPLLFVFMLIDVLRGKGLVTWEEAAIASPEPLESAMGFVAGLTAGGTLGRWLLWATLALTLLFIGAMAVIGFTLLDTGRATMRTLMSVGTSVPYWTGTAANDRVVRLVPPEGLTTWSFRLKPERAREYITSGRTQAYEQLGALLPG